MTRTPVACLVGVVLVSIACGPPHLAVREPTTPDEVVENDRVYGWETFKTKDGAQIFAQWWRPSGEVKGVVIVQHGLKDHGSRYDVLVKPLVDAGFAVHAADLRGHGRSSGARVAIDSFDQYVDDFAFFVDRVRDLEHASGKPLFLFGHSMGGAIVT